MYGAIVLLKDIIHQHIGKAVLDIGAFINTLYAIGKLEFFPYRLSSVRGVMFVFFFQLPFLLLGGYSVKEYSVQGSSLHECKSQHFFTWDRAIQTISTIRMRIVTCCF